MKIGKKEKTQKSSYVFTRETFGMTLLLFSAIVLIMLLTRSLIFAGIGKAVCTFMYGTFGFGSFAVVGLCAYLGEWLLFEKKLKIPFKIALSVSLAVIAFFLLFHTVSARDIPLNGYGKYISDCYTRASEGVSGYTFGGVVCALIVFPVAKLAKLVGAYIIFSLLLVAAGYLVFHVFYSRRKAKVKAQATAEAAPASEEAPVAVKQPEQVDNLYYFNESHELVENVQLAEPTAQVQPKPPVQPQIIRPAQPVAETAPVVAQNAEDDKFSQRNLGRKILFENDEFAAESYRRNMIFNENSYFNHPVSTKQDYLSSLGAAPSQPQQKPQENMSYSESYQNEILNAPAATPNSYVYGDKPVENLGEYRNADEGVYGAPAESEQPRQEVQYVSPEPEQPERVQPTAEKAEEEPPRPERRAPIDYFRTPSEPEQETPIARRAPEQEQSADDSLISPRGRDISPREDVGDEKPVDLRSLFSSENLPHSDGDIEPDISRISSRRREVSRENIFDDDNDDSEELFGGRRSQPEEEKPQDSVAGFGRRVELPQRNTERRVEKPAEIAPQPEQTEEEEPKHVWKEYEHPPIDLLDDYPENPNVNTGEIEKNKAIIVATFAKFKIDCSVDKVVIGPAITRYDVVIADNLNTKRSLNYKEAISMALRKDNVNAYLNYAQGALSIEVPNDNRTTVGLKSLIASSAFINSKPNSLTFALGKNVEGTCVCPDITKMPHLLVAGSSGSGKSVCLSALIISLLYKYGPEELRLILVDPKQVEFVSYENLPHLMINEIIYDVNKALKALNWAIKEMNRRYSLFKEMTARGAAANSITEYNRNLPEGEEKLPKVVIILDEFGDLMLQAKKEIERCIQSLAQKARACGIHLILATQRPSVDCITGLIKANLPTRIGFKVSSFDDSRTIFDIGGAEKLLGLGDMYFRSPDKSDLSRIQCCYVGSAEVKKVTDYIKAHNETYFDKGATEFINAVEEDGGDSEASGDDAENGDAKIDDSFIQALEFCVNANQASVSMIQRRFPVGYIKACKIIDWMERMNYITKSEGSKPRKVLLSKEEFVSIYERPDD